MTVTVKGRPWYAIGGNPGRDSSTNPDAYAFPVPSAMINRNGTSFRLHLNLIVSANGQSLPYMFSDKLLRSTYDTVVGVYAACPRNKEGRSTGRIGNAQIQPAQWVEVETC